MSKTRIILNSKSFGLTISRLCYQLVENHEDFRDSVIIGIQPRGIFLAKRISEQLDSIHNLKSVKTGSLDITFFRDDFRRRENPLIPQSTNIDFTIEDKRVILVDDVLYTGRTIRSAMDALLVFGRPRIVELLVLVERRFSRQLPIQPNYVGKTVDALSSDRVSVQWAEAGGEDIVKLYSPEPESI